MKPIRQIKNINAIHSVFVGLSASILALSASGCNEGLPQQGAFPTTTAPAAGTPAAAAGGTSGAATGSAGTGTGTGGAGARTTTANGGGSGADDDAPAGGDRDGGPEDDSTGDGTVDGGASEPAQPTGPVIAACMGRDGEAVCDRMTLIMCAEQGTGEELETCATIDQCKAGLETGVCGVCDPGEFKCTEADLESCSMTGQWELKETCPTPALCSEEMQSCNPSECAPDAVKCDGGQLMGCNMDQTDFEMLEDCMGEDLCDETNKRCNECVPDSVVCNDAANAVLKCSADGKGPAEMPCMAPTSKCLDGACIQCETPDDCEASGECMEATCNNNMCGEEPKPRETPCSDGGKCDAVGTCAACLVGGDDCGPDQRCIAGLGCVTANPLETSISFGNTFTVRLNAGYGAEVTNVTGSGAASIRIRGAGSGQGENWEALPMNEVRSFTVSGPFDSASGICPARPSIGEEITLEFDGPAPMEGVAAPECGAYATVTIRATVGSAP